MPSARQTVSPAFNVSNTAWVAELGMWYRSGESGAATRTSAGPPPVPPSDTDLRDFATRFAFVFGLNKATVGESRAKKDYTSGFTLAALFA